MSLNFICSYFIQYCPFLPSYVYDIKSEAAFEVSMFQNLDCCERSSMASVDPQNTDEESTSKITEEYEQVDKVGKVKCAYYAKLFLTISYL